MPRMNKKAQETPVSEPAKEKAPVSLFDMKVETSMMVAEIDKNIKQNEKYMKDDINAAVEKRKKGLNSSWETKKVAESKKTIEMLRKQRNSITTMVERREMFEMESALLGKMNSFMQNLALAASQTTTLDAEQARNFMRMTSFFEAQSQNMNNIVDNMSMAMTGDADEYLSDADKDIETAIDNVLKSASFSPDASNEEMTKRILEEIIP